MALTTAGKPQWLTFDCYGTLIRWDEGLQRVASDVARTRGAALDPEKIVEVYDQHESARERETPFRPFRQVAASAFPAALRDLGVDGSDADGAALLAEIPGFDPFPETLDTLARLKAAGFGIALISNTDDDLVAGNVAQLGGHVDGVVTAQQARAYKPSRLIFDAALRKLNIGFDEMVHICASPALDHTAARDQGFRCIWIDRGTYRKALADYTADATFPTLAGVTELFASLGWMTPRTEAR